MTAKQLQGDRHPVRPQPVPTASPRGRWSTPRCRACRALARVAVLVRTPDSVIVPSMFIVVPLMNRLMTPREDESVYVDPRLPHEGEGTTPAADMAAGKLEQSRALTGSIGLAGLFHDHVIQRGGINLNIVNFTFLFFAIILHAAPRRLPDSPEEAIKGTSGIALQFPFHASTMATMAQSGPAATLSERFVPFASAESLPLWTLPVLAIAGLKAKDIMGFCLIQRFVTGVAISIGSPFI